jgi:SPP1 family predicted phage head-tail adaptor
MTTRGAAGERTKRVEIQRPTKTVNGLGEDSIAWPGACFAKRSAKVETLSGRELQYAQQQVANVTHKLTFDYVKGLTTEMRIVMGDHTFGIDFIDNRDFANVEHVVFAKENP